MAKRKHEVLNEEKLRTSASGGDSQESPTTDWARTVAMIAAKDNDAVNTRRKRMSRAELRVLTKPKH